MIRHWAAAFEDANPVYTDPEAAAAVALRRDRGAAADAADLDDADADDHRHRRAGRLAGRVDRREPARRARRGRLHRHAGDELGVRDRALPPPRRDRVGPDGDRVDLRGEADPHRAGATSSPGSRPTPTTAARSSAARRSASSSSSPGGRCDEHPPRPVDVARHPVLLGRAEGAPAPDPALHRRAARCATRRGRCARAATRSAGTRSRRRAGARSTASSCRGTRSCRSSSDPYIVALVELEEGTRLVSNLCDVDAGGR